MTNHSVIVEVEFVVEQCARASESSLGRQQADTDSRPSDRTVREEYYVIVISPIFSSRNGSLLTVADGITVATVAQVRVSRNSRTARHLENGLLWWWFVSGQRRGAYGGRRTYTGAHLRGGEYPAEVQAKERFRAGPAQEHQCSHEYAAWPTQGLDGAGDRCGPKLPCRSSFALDPRAPLAALLLEILPR